MSSPATTTTPDPRRAYALLAGPAVIAAAALVGTGVAGAQVGLGRAAWSVTGVLLALPGSLLGNLPPALGVGRCWKTISTTVLGGLVLRFLITAGLMLGASLVLAQGREGTLIWAGVAQAVLLAVDVAGQMRLARLEEGARA